MKKIKVWFYIKQALPFMYWSTYKDANGNGQIAIWRQWFGKVLWCKRFAFMPDKVDAKGKEITKTITLTIDDHVIATQEIL